MKHYAAEEWSDYLRGLVSEQAAEPMRAHLQEGCSRCARAVAALECVLAVSATDLRDGPPAAAVRAVKALFTVQRLLQSAGERPSMSLAFDSLLANPVGVRGGESRDRHLVYQGDNLAVDLHLQPAGAESLDVVGQVVSGRRGPMADVPAFLLDGGRIRSQDLSTARGEFSLEGGLGGTLRLCLLMHDDRLIEIELPTPPTR